ncbi:MAG: salicylate 1-monooxygenase [Lasallia pustulata]|uniref:Salicylate 1-monooxygenase n=1 Tax=Lasallia pustulata TaxID=136370 RepID=A0A5M8PIB3_9LECA|nr:MAG: salicylate 1-monooxygenase [Lasallia pustulata]
MAGMMAEEKALEIAIVGGGITGMTLALGLLSRNINVQVYERGSSFREIGAGIGFTPNSEWAMRVLDPRIHAAFKRVAVQNATDWFQWVNGYGPDSADRNDHEELVYKMYLGERGFEGCHRADFLDELVQMMPEGKVEFNKNLDSIVDRGDYKKLLLTFRDGSSEEADAVIGCDGIRSRVRQLILGEGNPASYPGYSHKYAFRGLIPMEKARAALGGDKTSTRHMHLGMDAHALTFPVAGGALLNVVAFVTDPEEWPYKDKLTAPANKIEAVEAFAGFVPAVRAIMDLLPDKLDKWAVFDTYDHPASTYVSGRVCISGDAAHAAAPYHGAGAGFGIEDALALAALIKAAETMVCQSSMSKPELLRAAFDTYNKIRLERTQWLVESSRFIGELYEWQNPKIGRDAEKCGREIDWRSQKIWNYDVNAMMREIAEEYKQKLKM